MDHLNTRLLVIIVTYNGLEWIEKSITSVLSSSIRPDLFIVDNGSTDGTIEYIRNKYPEILFHISGKNLGFGKANNIGLKYALENNYDYVYLLNQDAWIEYDTIENLIRISELNPSFGVLSPLQKNRQKNKVDRILNSFLSEGFCPGLIDDLFVDKLKDIYHIKFVMAAHWLISIECLRKVGGFSPIFYHYGEDNNYLIRVLNSGFNVGLCPKIEVVHDREFRKDSLSKISHLTYTSRYLVPLSDVKQSFFSTVFKSLPLLFVIEIYLALRYKSVSPLRYLFRAILDMPKSMACRKRTREEISPFL